MPIALEGKWKMLRAEFAGQPAPELIVKKTEVELRNGKYIVRFDREIADRGTFELEGEGEGMTLVLHGTSGPNAGRTIPCIFQLVGDRLRICYGLDSVLPTEFATLVGQQRYLATYRRV
jgi:uncharacterized protein (TIGR03067 family)